MRRSSFLAYGVFLGVFALAQVSAAKNSVELKDGQGKSVGTIILWDQGADSIGYELHLHDLTAGEHALHFHQVPKCEGPDFKSAGPHFNPDNKKHGFDNPEGHHEGDLRNFTVAADGKASGRFEAKGIRLGDGPDSLFSNGPVAIVVHAKADDYKTDPSGNSGDRVACGIVAKEEMKK